MEEYKIPHVSKLTDVKITKVKPWAIYFKIKDEHYLLHEHSEGGETSIQLYHRELNEFGNWKLDCLVGDFIGQSLLSMIKTISKRGNAVIVYSQIDIKFFVFKLSMKGFITSCLDKEVKKTKKEIEFRKEEIKTLERILTEKRMKLIELS